MKLQGVAIIFIMIAFPMILVLSYYLGMQIDTIKLQTDYDNKLIDATYDSLLAFEINTANEDLSAAADSLRSIVNASATTFTNTLGTSLGLSNASKERIREYIPAMLFTLYDGYYIYAPTEVPIIREDFATDDEIRDIYGIDNPDGIVISEGARYAEDGSVEFEVDGGGTTTDSTQASTEQDYVLKSYMPYSATYTDGTNRATINYTLDNFMSVSAQIGNVYYTKSGYYIDNGLVSYCSIFDWTNMGQDQIKEYCESGKDTIQITVDGVDIIYDRIQKFDESHNPILDIYGQPTYYTMEELDKNLDLEYNNYQDLISANPRVETEINDSLDKIRDLEESLANLKSITYYLTNTAFSKWVNDNLGFVSGATLTNDDDDENPLTPAGRRRYTYYVDEKTDNGTNIYYDFSSDGQIFGGGNPEELNSEFNNHKYNIIKNAIQYNLNLAMSAYNQKYVSSHDFRMPMLTDNEWEQITQKVSIVSFMQGLPCGTKTYTGYSVVSSTNNELTVIPEEIYYVNADQFNDENSVQYYHRIDCPNIGLVTNFISFKSKEVKYDKIYDKYNNRYNYDHKNLACYTCIVQNNYTAFDWETAPNRSKAYYIAIGKERQNLYKTTGYSKNEGIEVISVNQEPGFTITPAEVEWLGDRIKAEITLMVRNPAGIVENLTVGSSSERISTSTISKQTVIINRNGDSGVKDIIISGTANIEIKSIKYIYK